MEERLIDGKWWLIGGFTLSHFLATMTCAMISCDLGMSRFDTAGAETLLEHITSVAAVVLLSPVYFLPEIRLGALDNLPFVGDLPVVANSFFWSICCYGALRIMLRRRIMAQA